MYSIIINENRGSGCPISYNLFNFICFLIIEKADHKGKKRIDIDKI